MNTINKIKKALVVFAFAVIAMPLTAAAQGDIFAKYSDNSDVTYVSIKPKMFQMLAKINVQTEDAESQEFMDMVKSITSFKTMATGNKAIATDVASWVQSRANTLEELMEVKENGLAVKFYVKEGKDADHVNELLMFVNGLDAVAKNANLNISGENLNMDTVVVSFVGDIDLDKISKLINSFDLPGGKEFENKSKK